MKNAIFEKRRVLSHTFFLRIGVMVKAGLLWKKPTWYHSLTAELKPPSKETHLWSINKIVDLPSPYVGNTKKVQYMCTNPRLRFFCYSFCDFTVLNPLNNQSNFLKFFWCHDFVQYKLDPRHFLKTVGKTVCLFMWHIYGEKRGTHAKTLITVTPFFIFTPPPLHPFFKETPSFKFDKFW